MCDDGFDQTDADVVCRQLGYHRANNYGNVGNLGYDNVIGYRAFSLGDVVTLPPLKIEDSRLSEVQAIYIKRLHLKQSIILVIF